MDCGDHGCTPVIADWGNLGGVDSEGACGAAWREHRATYGPLDRSIPSEAVCADGSTARVLVFGPADPDGPVAAPDRVDCRDLPLEACRAARQVAADEARAAFEALDRYALEFGCAG